MSDSVKRGLSFFIFGSGILIGLMGWFFLPMSTFAAGVNDSQPEVWALILMFGLPLPICVIALWKRKVAGLLSIAFGIYLPFAMLYQRSYMISIRHFGQQESISDTLLGFSYAYGAFLFVGAFALATDLLKWPALLNARVEEL